MGNHQSRIYRSLTFSIVCRLLLLLLMSMLLLVRFRIFFPSCRSVDRSVGRHWAVLKQYINYIIIFDCALAIVHSCIAKGSKSSGDIVSCVARWVPNNLSIVLYVFSIVVEFIILIGNRPSLERSPLPAIVDIYLLVIISVTYAPMPIVNCQILVILESRFLPPSLTLLTISFPRFAKQMLPTTNWTLSPVSCPICGYSNLSHFVRIRHTHEYNLGHSSPTVFAAINTNNSHLFALFSFECNVMSILSFPPFFDVRVDPFGSYSFSFFVISSCLCISSVNVFVSAPMCEETWKLQSSVFTYYPPLPILVDNYIDEQNRRLSFRR